MAGGRGGGGGDDGGGDVLEPWVLTKEDGITT